MNKFILIAAAIVAALAIVGCAEEPKASKDDEANIKRLASEGIGAPGDAAGTPPPSTNEEVRPTAGAPDGAPAITP
ncbi:MAG: hypothetical protein ACK4XJ_04155 [Fimbriimonadaceae bacterium]